MVDDRLDSAHPQRNSLRSQFFRDSVRDAAERDNARIDRDAYTASIDAGVSPIECILDVLLNFIVSHGLLHRKRGRVCQHGMVGNCRACATAANVGLPRERPCDHGGFSPARREYHAIRNRINEAEHS